MPEAQPNYVVQAYKRTRGETFEFAFDGLRVIFKPNDKNHCIATIPGDREDVFAALVDNVPEAYCEYTGKDGEEVRAEVKTPSQTEPPPPPTQDPELYVIYTTADGGDQVKLDLKTFSDDELRDFVKTNGIKGIHHAVKGDNLRKAITAAVGQEKTIPGAGLNDD